MKTVLLNILLLILASQLAFQLIVFRLLLFLPNLATLKIDVLSDEARTHSFSQ